MRETAVEPDVPSIAARTLKEKPNKEPMEKLKEENDTTEKVQMVQSQLHFIKYACEEILEYIDDGGEIEEWYQVKVAKSFSEFESLHAFIEGESRRTGMKESKEPDPHENPEYYRYHKELEKYSWKPQSIKKVKKTPEPDPHENPEYYRYHKEEVEQLDEIGDTSAGQKSLINYRDKSAKDIQKINSRFATGRLKKGETVDDVSRKNANRLKGWFQADKRIKEETEQLDEISAETKSSYTQKATKQVADMKPWTKKGEYKDIAKNIITRRKKGIAMAKEEVEQIDELSNELLGRYKDKAADDAMKADKAGDFKRGDKRFSGVVKATNKQFAAMRKKPFGEEVEELEEGENEQVKGGDPCWKGYEMVGMKKKNGKKVPNCVPEETEHLDEVMSEPDYNQSIKARQAKADRDSIPFDPDPPKKRQVVPGKHGAAYSTARHLARQALKKQAEKMKPVKESLDESRKTEIVKEIVKKKKNEKNDTESFQKEPVLSSEITKA
jgi:hypothetical protein